MGAAGTNLLGFADPDLQAFIGSVGAAPAPPELTIAEAVMSPDLF
jgi:hypothetical protein